MASWFPDSSKESGLTRFLRLIRFSHTVFALPFALGALLVATHGRPSLRLLILVLLCMVFARTSAMLFNRIADWTLVYQSRSGRPQDPWLEPDVCDYLRREHAQGLGAAILCPAALMPGSTALTVSSSRIGG